MTEAKLGFMDQIKSYPRAFWVANTMEIFERMSWYGWFTVMALYVTGSVETGGLGFSTELRGALQGIVPFFLYLFPVVTGALADRYGYKRMFVIAYLVMILAYYLLGLFSTVPTFFLAFMFVAVGAAIFKPVVVGTVAKVTNDSNSATGFGIFYMMVNIGGFFGPIVAGLVRGQGWEWVFVACSGWAAINLIIVSIFYKEPYRDLEAESKRSLRSVGENAVEVLGNMRFFVTVFTVLFALMFANLDVGPFKQFTWTYCAMFIPAWLILNFLWDAIMPARSGLPASKGGPDRLWLMRRMHCSNWRFALFLLIMSGFWTSFNQIFYTMPEYIRDFVNTRPIISAAESIFGESDATDPDSGIASKIATINEQERDEIIRHINSLRQGLSDTQDSGKHLLETLPPKRIKEFAEGTLDDIRTAAFGDALEDDKLEDQVKALDRAQVAAMLQAAEHVLGADWRTTLQIEAVEQTSKDLLHTKVRIAPDPLRAEVERPLAALQPDVLSALQDAVTPLIAARPSELPEDSVDLPKDIKDQLKQASEDLGKQDIELSRDMLTGVFMEGGDTASSIAETITLTQCGDTADRIIIAGRQVNPEYIVNINAGAIVLFQVLISYLMCRFHQFTTMIVGMVIAAVGIGFACFAGSPTLTGPGALIWLAAGGIFIFSFGEMMASPTSQEYVGRIAPGDKKALYMGYYFVAVALGNLFGGILSGELMGKLAYDMGRPDLMWLTFGGIMLGTAIVFLIYNKLCLPKDSAHELT